MRTRLREGVRDLEPDYFALVMATGIVSIATFLLKMWAVAWVLFGINIIAYGILGLFTLARLIWFFPQVLADYNHSRGPGFFTLAAGTCILGSQFVIEVGDYAIGADLWFLGFFLWLVVMYTFVTAVTVHNHKPSLEHGINGAWLVATVATQSVSILGTLISSQFENARSALLFLLVRISVGSSLASSERPPVVSFCQLGVGEKVRRMQ